MCQIPCSPSSVRLFLVRCPLQFWLQGGFCCSIKHVVTLLSLPGAVQTVLVPVHGAFLETFPHKDRWWHTSLSLIRAALLLSVRVLKVFPGGASGKEPACQRRRCKRLRFDSGWGRPPGGGHGNPLQCSCLENPMDRGGWWATVHGVAQSKTWLSD